MNDAREQIDRLLATGRPMSNWRYRQLGAEEWMSG